MNARITSTPALGLIGACLLWLASAVVTAPAYAAGQLEIWYLRHAETVGNVTHSHSKKDDSTLSSKGQRQVRELTRRLDRLHFDHVIVSPKERAMLTIRPWLNKHGLHAEIWPELTECCWQKNHHDAKYRRGIDTVYQAADRIRSRFGGTNQRILVVGHYHSGSRLVEVLQGREPNGRYKLRNTGMMQLFEKGDGYFQLVHSE